LVGEVGSAKGLRMVPRRLRVARERPVRARTVP